MAYGAKQQLLVLLSAHGAEFQMQVAQIEHVESLAVVADKPKLADDERALPVFWHDVKHVAHLRVHTGFDCDLAAAFVEAGDEAAMVALPEAPLAVHGDGVVVVVLVFLAEAAVAHGHHLVPGLGAAHDAVKTIAGRGAVDVALWRGDNLFDAWLEVGVEVDGHEAVAVIVVPIEAVACAYPEIAFGVDM